MNMKKIGILLSTYAMAAGMGFERREKEHIPLAPPGSRKIIPNGCKEFTIDGITVIAVTEKSAKKKVRKLKNQNQ